MYGGGVSEIREMTTGDQGSDQNILQELMGGGPTENIKWDRPKRNLATTQPPPPRAMLPF